MIKLDVYNKTGKKVGDYEFDPKEIAPFVNRQLLHDAVVMYEANERQGSAKTKTRGEVSGHKKKMYRQKGTGNARAGSVRSGIRRGGGHIFAKRTRDFSYRLPRKAIQNATRMAVATKIRDDQVVIIDELSFSEPKTREMATILGALPLDGTVLIATEQHDPNIHRSARNIPGVSVAPVSDLNALSILKPRKVLFTRAALDAFRENTKQRKIVPVKGSGKQEKAASAA